MNKTFIKKQKELLLSLKSKILNGGILRSTEDLAVSPEDLPDEADLATSVINQQVTFNIRQRELSKLRSVEEALHRVQEGTYGHCEECEEAIAVKRLENQPWANLCITHAEEEERQKGRFSA
ncbi:MAG: TraR/DksA family transcriptional regulator [Halobacteriovoraceae bacterium]|jgi:DnaK suppressor protein|nr:TraR/DksA family transcriptional regulator [Halobacteriovoraceae bacterium]